MILLLSWYVALQAHYVVGLVYIFIINLSHNMFTLLVFYNSMYPPLFILWAVLSYILLYICYKPNNTVL